MSAYIPILVFTLVAVSVPIITLLLVKLVSAGSYHPVKAEPYECGVEPTTVPYDTRFSARYYLIAVLFVVFDVETVFLYPWAVMFRRLAQCGFIEMTVFLYSFQGHAIYNFSSGIWGSLDATYFTGGRTTLNGTLNNDLQQNWRLGGTLAFPVDAHNSVKLYLSSGVSARPGNSFDLIGIAWQYRWGGGL